MRPSIRTVCTSAAVIAAFAAALGLAQSAAQAGSEKPAMVLRHVVLFKFKAEATTAEIRAVEQAFCALPSKIDAIHDFEWGTDVSVENLHKGFTHCFFVSFKSEADRDRYLPHPDHEAFVKLVGPVLDDVIAFDYWTRP